MEYNFIDYLIENAILPSLIEASSNKKNEEENEGEAFIDKEK